jgi:Rad3-related DNA helicase
MLRKYYLQLKAADLELPDASALQESTRHASATTVLATMIETVAEQPVPADTPVTPTVSMRQVLGPGGVIARSLPGYEHREPQLQMAEMVWDAINAGEHALVEAGTGVGKSLAYLVPAAYSHLKTVVSTGDKGLQMQLWQKDLPFLQEHLPIPFRAAILKGRANYVCLHRWREEIGEARDGEMELFKVPPEYGAIKHWLETSDSGDLEECPLAIPPETLAKITSTAAGCLGNNCPAACDCWAEKAKDRAEVADIVIVNHTLLTLDAWIRQQSGDFAKVIPDRNLVIIDKAHRLEDAATLAFQQEASHYGVMRLLSDRCMADVTLPPGAYEKLEHISQEFFGLLAKVSNQQSYTVSAPSAALEAATRNLAEALKDISIKAEQGSKAEGAAADALRKHTKRIREQADAVSSIWEKSDDEIVYVEKGQGKREELVYLRRCPVCVAESLRTALFEKWPTICTSATLATGDNFDYFRSRVGCDDGEELMVDSPFDYGRNALIYMPANGGGLDPTRYYQEGSVEYFDRLAQEIESLLLASDGRAFCLFSSTRALNEVYQRIAHRLRWLVLRQGEAPRPELVRQFKASGKAVLFGLRSFGEGVDVQGEALSLVVIDKLSFSPPDDPVYKARCDQLIAASGNKWAWFSGLALPGAIITVKQNFGRLIRTKSDRGVVALLDGRVTTKNYGGTVLNSLPPASRTRSLEAVKTFFDSGAQTGERQDRLF